MNTIIESIKKDIHDVINNISTQNLIKVLKYASNKYYNEEEVLTDKEYDTLYELLKTKSPKNAFLKQTVISHFYKKSTCDINRKEFDVYFTES